MIKLAGYRVTEQLADDPERSYSEIWTPTRIFESFAIVRDIVNLQILEEGMFELKIVRDSHLLEIRPEYRKA